MVTVTISAVLFHQGYQPPPNTDHLAACIAHRFLEGQRSDIFIPPHDCSFQVRSPRQPKPGTGTLVTLHHLLAFPRASSPTSDAHGSLEGCRQVMKASLIFALPKSR